MIYRIIVGSSARRDVRLIASYIRSHSPRGAAAWLKAYESALKSLSSNAEGCSLADEYHRFDIEVRQLLFSTRRGKNYRLLFTIVGDEVRILRVRGPGQSDVEPDEI